MSNDQQPRELYAVSEGDYSDYRIRALFEREEDAEQARALGLGDRVETILLYPSGLLPQRQPRWQAQATIWTDGYMNGGGTVRTQPRHTWPEVDDPALLNQQFPPVEIRENPARNGWTVYVYSDSEERARKICSDEVAKLKAQALEPGADL